MLLSKSCEYAMQAVLAVARNDSGGFVPARQIAESTGIPYHFLGKIIQTLIKSGLLRSYKGPNGGVCLNRPAESLTLFDVVSAIDGLAYQNRCFLGLAKCDGHCDCALHEDWGRICHAMTEMLQQRTFADLLAYFDNDRSYPAFLAKSLQGPSS